MARRSAASRSAGSRAGKKISPEVQERIVTAREDLAVAERELLVTLQALPQVLRAEKQMVSQALRLALDKLTDAKLKLESVLES